MFRIAQLFVAIAASRIANLRHWAGRRMIYGVLLGVFGLLTVIFALVLITAALAQWLGLLAALGIMTGTGALACLIVVAVKSASDRRHRRRARQKAELQTRLTQLAMLSTMRKTKRLRGPVGLLLAGGAIAFVVSRFLGGDED